MADFTLAAYNAKGPKAVGVITVEVATSVTVEAPVEFLEDPNGIYPEFELLVVGLNQFANMWRISDLDLNDNGYMTFTFHNDSAGVQGNNGDFRLTVAKR